MNRKVKLVHFGLGGHMEEFTVAGTRDSGHLSGYSRPANWTPCRGDGEWDYLEALFLDKREPLKADPRLALTMPLPGVWLKPGESERCPKPSSSLLAGLSGSFLGLAKLRDRDEGFAGLDTVDCLTYAALWRERGARLGVWDPEGGTPDPDPGGPLWAHSRIEEAVLLTPEDWLSERITSEEASGGFAAAVARRVWLRHVRKWIRMGIFEPSPEDLARDLERSWMMLAVGIDVLRPE